MIRLGSMLFSHVSVSSVAFPEPRRPVQDMMLQYVQTPYRVRRRLTRAIQVGDVEIGGENPIRIQSMTNTDTMDTKATVDQIERLAASGCEIARVTAPSIRDAENLRQIRAELSRRGVRIPLVADIHFTPNAAMIAAECVEKVRINPGNYADKKKFEVREYDDVQYEAELNRVADRFRPLVQRCRENGVAMRIGTNHGSLSDRIMNRFGDSALGMVESALEFLDVCEDENYRNLVFSMKASNTHVALQAYRLLAARLEERAPGEPAYPFHLGVTEAGDAEDGRIKSAIGIGGLLEDGIGDTIRVSLTEDPVREIPVARRIAERATVRWHDAAKSPDPQIEAPLPFVPFDHQRRLTQTRQTGELEVGGEEAIAVELDLGTRFVGTISLADAAMGLARSLRDVTDVAAESFLMDALDESGLAQVDEIRRALDAVDLKQPLAVRIAPDLLDAGCAIPEQAARVVLPVKGGLRSSTLRAAIGATRAANRALEFAIEAEPADLTPIVQSILAAGVKETAPPWLFSVLSEQPTQAVRVLAALLGESRTAQHPIVLRHLLTSEADANDAESALIAASTDLGVSLCDGIGDMLSLGLGSVDPGAALDLAYRILQGARLRTTRTEYISCPSCGRTLFDLEETTARIKQATGHLTGVKIAVMGCIVNGPGEMADADFGYVGSGPGKVNLYAGKEVVARGVPEAEATDRLVSLIQEYGCWAEESL